MCARVWGVCVVRMCVCVCVRARVCGCVCAIGVRSRSRDTSLSLTLAHFHTRTHTRARARAHTQFSALRQSGLDPRAVEEIMRDVDQDGDGAITLEEFRNCTQSPTHTHIQHAHTLFSSFHVAQSPTHTHNRSFSFPVPLSLELMHVVRHLDGDISRLC